MKNRKNRFIPLLSLLLCTVVMMSFSLPAMAADPQAIEGFFTNFNGNENFSSAVWTVTTATGATTEGTGSASVDSNGVISVSVLAGSDSCGPVTSTITVTLTAKKTISFQYTLTDNDKGTLSLAYASGGTSSKDGKNYAVVKENDIVKFELSCEYNSESNKATGTITITDIQEATSKVPDDCASYSVGGTAYSYLDLAIIAASSGSDKVILVTNDGTVYHSSIEKENTEAHIKDFTIPDGVTLMVPYSNDAESNSDPLTEPTMVKEADKDGTKTLTRTLKVPSDVRIYCEGNIRVDAKQYACSQRQTGHVRDNYAKIILDGEIHLKGSGTLRAYGYITGNGFVDAESGNIYELFQISDWRGGTVTSTIKSKLQNESFLISCFYIQNIETDLIVHSQANLSAYMAIAAGYGSAKDPYNSEVKLIADDGLFTLVSDDTQVTREYSSGRMTYKIDGDSSLGSITVQIARVESINSNDYVLNLPSSMTIELVDGTCTMPIRVKLLPGAEVKVHKGATLEMTGSSQLILYDYDVWTAGKFTYTGTFYEATHSEGTRMKSLPKSHGKLTVDGTLKIGDGSAVYTTTGYSSKTVDVGTTAITGSGTIQIGKAPSSLRTVIKEVQNNDKSTSNVTVAPAVLKNTSGTQTATNGKTFKNTDGKWICDVNVNAHVDSNIDELCDVCGAAVKHTHSYTEATVRPEALKQAATCIAQAVYYKSCACGDISTNDAEIFSSGDMIPHDMSRTVEAAVAATCTKNGKTAVMGCSRCAYTEGGAVEPAIAHAYTAKSDAEDALVTPATCQSNAVYKAMCAVCSDKNTDETFEEANSKLQHSYTGGWATPTDAGHAKLCVNGCGQANPVVSEHAYENACDTDCACGYTRTAPHSFATMKDSGVLANPASCTANQQNKVQCDNCTAISETLTVEVAGTQLPHTCDQTKAEDKYLKTKANCQSAAVYYKSCVCGAFSSADDAATFSNGSKDANNHVNANSTWEKTEAGHRNYWACCGADIVPQAEHSYVNGVCSLEGCAYACTHTGGQLEYTSNDNSTHKAVYDCCGKVESEAAAHTPGQWTTIQAATCVAPGSKQAACSACNASITQEIEIDGNAHNRAETWIPTPNGANHYQKCQNEGCMDMGTLGVHADTNNNHKCDACDYEMSQCADGEDADHECDVCGKEMTELHKYTIQNYNENQHWMECSCGAKSEETAHTFGETYEKSGDKHWKECACGAKSGEADHDWADDCDTTCDTCGQTREVEGHESNAAYPCQDGECIHCGTKMPATEAHDWVDADCDTPKTCETCGATEGDALGHTPGAAADCVNAQTCTVCGEELNEATGHAMRFVQFQDATCTQPGTDEHYVCENCNGIYADEEGQNATTVEKLTIKAKGHQYEVEGEPKFIDTDGDAETFEKCELHLVCYRVYPEEHKTTVVTENVELVEDIAADCLNNGSKKFVATFETEEYKGTQTKTITIESLGHTEETLEAVAPTCTTTGLTEGKKCSVCGEILEAQVEIPAKHTLEKVEAKAATCTKEGNIEHWKCTAENCGKLFLDGNGVEVTTEEYVKIPAAHKDEVDPKHICDICAETISVCEDKDGDKLCDICGESMVKGVAQIGETIYKNLEAALDAAKALDNPTITLLANIEGEVTISQAVTIVKNGKTINIAVTAEYQMMLSEDEETVTITKKAYTYGQTVQIGLREPWFLKANCRVYIKGVNDNIDYSKLDSYGVYFVRGSDLAPGTTQNSVTVADILNNENTAHYSSEDGSAFIDGSYISAEYNEGLYTYELSDSVFVMFYIVENGETTYISIRERNLKNLIGARKDDASTDANGKPYYGVYERGVYATMYALENAITEYRAQFTADEIAEAELPTMNAPLLKDYVNDNGAFTAETNVKYSFGNTAQIVLVEPWGLKLNARVYNSANPTNINYSSVEEYGAIVFYDTDGIFAASGMTKDQLMNYENAYVFSNKNGDSFVDGSYISVVYNKEIYTYMLDSTAYVMFYVKDSDGYHYGDIKARNIYNLASARKDDTSIDKNGKPNYGELERKVYAAMVAEYEAVKIYREDYFKNNPN